jgi:hypothetical protein
LPETLEIDGMTIVSLDQPSDALGQPDEDD